ncbi:Ribonuclease BN, tRNA processing enzyme [Micrococcales bacterium KH10]|nr:Ribonuclease BN, tRNA processing enzyme [Micrococcales bacterium KH10]
MRLRIVGCSGSFAGPSSAGSCYLVSADDDDGKEWNVLLDLGSGAFGQLQRYIDPVRLDAVAISHLHADHIADITGLEVYLSYHPIHGRACREPLPVHGPSGTAERVRRLCGTEPDSEAPAVFHHLVWKPNDTIQIGPLTMTPFLVEHPVEAYAMRITGPSESPEQGTATLTFTGDTDQCAGLDEAARDVDLLLSEAAFVEGRDDAVAGIHLTGKRAGEVASRAGVRRLALTHIPPWNETGTALAEAAEVFSGPTCEVIPGQIFDI